MDILRLHGTDRKLYELVAPLVMNPAVLRQNNNYPFKTGSKYTWYVSTEKGEVTGFIPLKKNSENSYLIDNYYIKGDDASVLNGLLAEITANRDKQAELLATVHKRHTKLFVENGFHPYIEWKNYEKMQYCSRGKTACAD